MYLSSATAGSEVGVEWCLGGWWCCCFRCIWEWNWRAAMRRGACLIGDEWRMDWIGLAGSGNAQVFYCKTDHLDLETRYDHKACRRRWRQYGKTGRYYCDALGRREGEGREGEGLEVGQCRKREERAQIQALDWNATQPQDSSLARLQGCSIGQQIKYIRQMLRLVNPPLA